MSNDVTLLVLLSLSSGPKHGYAIQEDVAQEMAVRLGPGTLYGAISRLESDGLISPLEVDGRRRPYQMTESGRRVLREKAEALSSLVLLANSRLAASSCVDSFCCFRRIFRLATERR